MAAPRLLPSDTPFHRLDGRLNFRAALRQARLDRAHERFRRVDPDYRRLARPLPADRLSRVRLFLENVRARVASERALLDGTGAWSVYEPVEREWSGHRWIEPVFVASYGSEAAAERALIAAAHERGAAVAEALPPVMSKAA